APRRHRRPAPVSRALSLLALADVAQGVLDPAAPVLRADDEGVLRGRAVFETLRVYGGTPFKLEAHLERLGTSAKRLRLPEPPYGDFADAAAAAVRAGGRPDATLRLLWTAGQEGGGGAPQGLVLVSTLPPGLEELRVQGLKLAVRRWAPGALAGTKSTSYAENIAAQHEAAERGAG